MKKIVIWGCGGFASRFLDRYETLMQDDYSIIGFTGNNTDRTSFRDKPFYAPASLNAMDIDAILVLSGFSYDIENQIRDDLKFPKEILIRTDILKTLFERYKDKENEINPFSYREMMAEGMKFSYTGKFVDRSRGRSKLLIVLAGYKEYLYDAVFSRIIKYMDPDMDVCLITSGKYDETVLGLCEKHDWSYLSVDKNNVSLVQNVAIKCHPHAEYIFKLDEDMFITKGFFQKMIRAYEHAQQGPFSPGIMAPTIPINGFGFMKVIQELHLESEFEKRFGELRYQSAYSLNRPILKNTEFARFMWGEGGYVPDIDTLNEMFEKHEIAENPCPVLFNIGAILFTRRYWYQMKFFTVDDSVGLGSDERQMNEFCITSSQPVMISDNIVVGHFGFGEQTEGMKAYRENHRFE